MLKIKQARNASKWKYSGNLITPSTQSIFRNWQGERVCNVVSMESVELWTTHCLDPKQNKTMQLEWKISSACSCWVRFFLTVYFSILTLDPKARKRHVPRRICEKSNDKYEAKELKLIFTFLGGEHATGKRQHIHNSIQPLVVFFFTERIHNRHSSFIAHRTRQYIAKQKWNIWSCWYGVARNIATLPKISHIV